MFTATRDAALLTTTTGALPRPSWYTENLRGAALATGFSQRAYREQHFDCLACHVAAQHRAGIDILVDGDARLDDDVAGRSWQAYAYERIAGIGAPRTELQPAPYTAEKRPGDFMWQVIETRMTPHVTGAIGDSHLQLDRAYKAMAGMTRRPVKLGSVSAQLVEYQCIDEHYGDRFELLMALSDALNAEYHALADAGAPIVQIEEPTVHMTMGYPDAPITPEQYVEAFNREVRGLRDKTEVWCHTCWGSPGAQRVEHAALSYSQSLPYYDRLDVDVLTFEGASNGGADIPLYGSMISQDKKIAVGRDQPPHAAIERPEEVATLVRRCLEHTSPNG